MSCITTVRAADVVENLSQAESLKAIKSHAVSYGNSNGYEYETTKALPKLLELAGNQHVQYEDDIAWVVTRFGGESAAKLELIATIVFAELSSSVNLVQLRSSGTTRP